MGFSDTFRDCTPCFDTEEGLLREIGESRILSDYVGGQAASVNYWCAIELIKSWFSEYGVGCVGVVAFIPALQHGAFSSILRKQQNDTCMD